jgi:glutamate racemase
MSKRPIGVFDSGIGGISFLKEAKLFLPNENFVYFGDNANAPYGVKSKQEILDLSLNCADFLFNKDVKAMVIACNTATSASVKLMREKYDMPILSMEPAIKPALQHAKYGKVVVLATCGTILLERYNRLVNRLDLDHKIENIACEGLVEMIENGKVDDGALFEYFDVLFKTHKIDKIDSLVLGCTHYVFIKDTLNKYMKMRFGGEKSIFDGNLGTAKQLKRVLESNNMINFNAENGTVLLYSSGKSEVIEKMHQLLL